MDKGFMEIPNFIGGSQSLKSELFGFYNEIIYLMMYPSSGAPLPGAGVGAPSKNAPNPLNTNVITVARIPDKYTHVFTTASYNHQPLQTVVLTTSEPRNNKHAVFW